MDNKFRTQIASDVIRDGLGLELLDRDNNVIAEVFRSDAKKSLTLNTFNNDISLLTVEWFIALSLKELEPFEDGTRLSEAQS